MEGGRSRLVWVRIGDVRGMSVWLWAIMVMLVVGPLIQVMDVWVTVQCDSAKGGLVIGSMTRCDKGDSAAVWLVE